MIIDFRQHPVKIFQTHGHAVRPLFMCVVKMSHLSATPCQDVPSFGRFIPFVRNSCVLSRCLIFRQHPVKMSHLSAGSYCLCVIHVCCQDVSSFGNTLSRCPIFRQVHTVCPLFMCVVKMFHLSATPCQDVPSFGRFILFVRYSCVLSRCLIFRQHPVKMSHLSAGSYCLYVFMCVVKMSHLSATPCQDVPSFGRFILFVRNSCVMSHLSATLCQDVPSFGRFILFVRNSCVLSRCPIFRQHPVKMSHLSAGSYCLCVIHVCCQDLFLLSV